MARLDPLSASLNLSTSLKDSVVVLTGGARGIGLSTLQTLSSRGAHVIVGDVNEPPSPLPTNCTFLKTDVRSYDAILAVFKHALAQHGRVDHAISNAGVIERPGWFDPKSGVEGVESPPDMFTEEVNLRAAMWFAHIAVQYLSHNATGDENKSLTLVSSVAGFKETPGLFVYQASKHGVLGLMRSLRLYLPTAGFKARIRVNAICPGGTDTVMVAGIKDGLAANNGPKLNSTESLAKVVVAVTAAGKGTQAVWYDGKNGQGTRRRKNRGGMDWDDDEREARGMSGRAWYVVEGEAWDIEEGLDRTEDLWMGWKASDLSVRNQTALGAAATWLDKDDKPRERQLDIVNDE